MQIAFVSPSPSESGGGAGTEYVAQMVQALRQQGHEAMRLQQDEPVPPGFLPVIDGMVLPAMHHRQDALLAADAVVLVHHLGAAAGQDTEVRAEVRAAEQAMLPRFRRVVAASAPVAERLHKEFGVAAPAVVDPGINDLPRAAGSGGAGCRILSAGVLTPRKGHDRLLRALGRLADLDWSLLIAGDPKRHKAHADGLMPLADELGLASRVRIKDLPSEADWSATDLFALATRWEGYASGIAQALRRGIAVIVTQGGASAALVGPDCAAVCSQDDPATFSKTLRRMIFDRTLRDTMAEAAWRRGQALPSWHQQAEAFGAVLGR